jgi:RNA polymerase sigma-70 factor, ECF subfamily
MLIRHLMVESFPPAKPSSTYHTDNVVLSDLDRTLLNRCLAGASGAWEDFLDRYLPLLVHVVNETAKLRFDRLPDQWRDDVVAEVLLTLVDNQFEVLRQFQGQSSLGTYLVVVARRVAVRKIGKLRRLNTAMIVSEPTSSNDNGIEALLEQSEQVQHLLGKLPDTEAQVIRMFHLEHRSYAEISSHMGIPENTVGPLLSRARTRMKSLSESA